MNNKQLKRLRKKKKQQKAYNVIKNNRQKVFDPASYCPVHGVQRNHSTAFPAHTTAFDEE